GKKLPKADKTTAPETAKSDDVVCLDCGKIMEEESKFCPGCGTPSRAGAEAAKVTKGDDITCLGCGKDVDDDDHYCSECGTENPHFKGKATKPTPADGVTGQSADPVPEHREPDGPAVEAFEHDAD